MILDWFADLRAYFSERLTNPLLAPFTIAWLVTNWRLVTILLFSNMPIERRIAFIDENYLAVSHLLVIPLGFAVSFALVIPWATWLIQLVQERANLGRRKHKLSIETEYLTASVQRAEAQATLNRILAQDEITRRQQQELEDLKEQLARQQSEAQARIANAQAELESRRQEYEKLNHAEKEAANKEIQRLNAHLEEEKKHAEMRRRVAEDELLQRQKELEERLKSNESSAILRSDVDFNRFLTSNTFRLFHNPKVGPGRSKVMTFLTNGDIGEGRNDNEYAWRTVGGKLEIVQADGKVHSRFYFLPPSRIFVHTGDKDTKSARGQYIIQEN